MGWGLNVRLRNIINQMYQIYALLSSSDISCIASASSALPTTAPKEGADAGNVIRAHIVDFGEVLAKIKEKSRSLFQAGLLSSSQLHIKSSHKEPNPLWESSRGLLS